MNPLAAKLLQPRRHKLLEDTTVNEAGDGDPMLVARDIRDSLLWLAELDEHRAAGPDGMASAP